MDSEGREPVRGLVAVHPTNAFVVFGVGSELRVVNTLYVIVLHDF